MENNHSEIDVYAVGTNIATCKKQPALGLVCKLTQINGVPKMKFSSDPEKATFPGRKQVYRVWTDSEKSSFDLLALDDEPIHLGEQEFSDTHGKVHYNITKFELMNKELDISQPTKSLVESRKFVQESMKELPDEIFQLKNAQKRKVLLTSHFYDSLQKTMANKTLELAKAK
jgi:nicotinate phosphoribosyltransferase